MAKARGGLGRGIDSLLGDQDGRLANQSQAPATRVDTVNEEVPSAPAAPVQDNKQEPVEVEPQPSSEPTVIGGAEEVKEDNVTIKGVISREVTRPATIEETIEASVDEKVNESDEVDINLIEPNPDQPRTNFKKEELSELAESIKKNGLLQPILVRKKGNKYQIIAGERRWQACKSLGMKKVPIRVKEADDSETIILALVENIQRSNLNPIEEAYGYRRMMERGKMTQSEVAQAVSKGRTTITNALRLLELPEDAQQLLFEEKITAGHARAILSVPTKEGRRKLTDKLVEEQLSVREAERIARLLSGVNKESAKSRLQAPKSYKTVARALRDTLGTEVKIKSVKGKNKIEIAFKDEADLERLYRVIANS